MKLCPQPLLELRIAGLPRPAIRPGDAKCGPDPLVGAASCEWAREGVEVQSGSGDTLFLAWLMPPVSWVGDAEDGAPMGPGVML